jgi:group I intron endonuclease
MAILGLRRPGVYVIRNTVNGKVYVGSAVKIYDRWKAHRSLLNGGAHHSRTMQRSWDKHGQEAFSFEVLEVVEEKTRLIEREQYWIDFLHAACPKRGFNNAPTAGSSLGIVRDEEFKRRLSDARKGIPKSPEHAAAIGAAQVGKIIPDSQRALLSASVKRYYENNPSARNRMSAIGKTWGPLNGNKVGSKLPQATRDAMSATRQSREDLKDISRAALASLTPDQRAKALVGRLGRPIRKNRSLTYEQAQEARALKASGWTYDRLTEKFGLDRASMFRLIKGLTYTMP